MTNNMDNKNRSDASKNVKECDKKTVEPDIKSLRYDQTPSLPQSKNYTPLPQSENEHSSAAPIGTLNFKQHFENVPVDSSTVVGTLNCKQRVENVPADSSTVPGAVPVYPSNVDPSSVDSDESQESFDEFSEHDHDTTRGLSHDVENDIVEQEALLPIAAQVVEDDKSVAEIFDTRMRAEMERLEDLVRHQIMSEATKADVVTSPSQSMKTAESPKGDCASIELPKVILYLAVALPACLFAVLSMFQHEEKDQDNKENCRCGSN